MRKVSRVIAALALVIAALGVCGASPVLGAAGNMVADVSTPEGAGPEIGLSFDGQYLYYAERNGAVLHRIDVPPLCGPPCVTSVATGHIDIAITSPLNPLGIGGVNTMSTKRRRSTIWDVGGDVSTLTQLGSTDVT